MNNGLRESKWVDEITQEVEIHINPILKEKKEIKKEINDLIKVRGNDLVIMQIQIYGDSALFWCDVGNKKIPFIIEEFERNVRSSRII